MHIIIVQVHIIPMGRYSDGSQSLDEYHGVQ